MSEKVGLRTHHIRAGIERNFSDIGERPDNLYTNCLNWQCPDSMGSRTEATKRAKIYELVPKDDRFISPLNPRITPWDIDRHNFALIDEYWQV